MIETTWPMAVHLRYVAKGLDASKLKTSDHLSVMFNTERMTTKITLCLFWRFETEDRKR